jgi:hypothetical protein
MNAKGLDVRDINPLVDLAVAFRDQVPCRVDKAIRAGTEEEVIPQNFFRLQQLLLGLFEIKVHVQRFDKVGQRVGILVPFLLDHPYQVLQLLLVRIAIPALAAVSNDSRSQIPQDPWADGLYCVDEGGREEKLGQNFFSGVVVEEGEEAPVDQPGAVVELRKRVVEEFGVDALFDFLDFFHGVVPFCAEDFGG